MKGDNVNGWIWKFRIWGLVVDISDRYDDRYDDLLFPHDAGMDDGQARL
jgi:hypothetical protein